MRITNAFNFFQDNVSFKFLQINAVTFICNINKSLGTGTCGLVVKTLNAILMLPRAENIVL